MLCQLAPSGARGRDVDDPEERHAHLRVTRDGRDLGVEFGRRHRGRRGVCEQRSHPPNDRVVGDHAP